ncbi:integrase, catalytic region, zinc finger, CCHC-type containing protein, partial [Tanacetum coccineum]
WVKFLRSKDETPEFVIKFLKQIQVSLNKTVRYIHTDNGTEFVNKDLTDYYERVGIFHQKSIPRTPQQNDVVKRQNRTPARIMLIFSKAPMFLWAKAVATALRILENYNQLLILEFSLVMHQAGRVIESTTKEPDASWKLFTFNSIPVSPAPAVSVSVTSAGTPSSTTIDQDAPSPSHSPSSLPLQSPSLHQGIVVESTLMENNPFAPVDNDPFINVFAPEPSFEASSSGNLSSAESPYVTQTLQHLRKLSKDHPLDNVIGNPSRPVSTRK